MARKTDKIRCPFTGRMVPRPAPRNSRVDLIEGTPPSQLPEEVTMSEKERVAGELASIRAAYAALSPGHRAGITGDKLSKKYRKLALEYWHLTGKHCLPVYGDM